MEKVKKITEGQLINKAKFSVGDTVRVHQKIKEGDKERIQIFEGLVLAKKHGKGINATFTVRKVTSGVGVEKVFPVHSPMIDKIEIVKSGKIRRSKIYYIREATGRRGRLKEVKREHKEEPEAEVSEKVVAEEVQPEADQSDAGKTEEEETTTQEEKTTEEETKEESKEVAEEEKKEDK